MHKISPLGIVHFFRSITRCKIFGRFIIRAGYLMGWQFPQQLNLPKLWMQSLPDRFSDPILRTAILDAKHVNIQHPFFQRPAYGLGVMIDLQSHYGIMVGHGGGGPGYSAGVLHFPSIKGYRITSAALCNDDRDELGLKIAFQAGMMMGSILTDNDFLSSP